MQGTMPGARAGKENHARPIDNIKISIGLLVEESIRLTQDIDKWRKYVHGMAKVISKLLSVLHMSPLNRQPFGMKTYKNA